MQVFSVHASWLSDEEIVEGAVVNVNQNFRTDDEQLCAWVDEKNPSRFIVSFDVEATEYVEAARRCLGLVAEVTSLEPRVGQLEEVGAMDEEGYIVVQSEDFAELNASG